MPEYVLGRTGLRLTLSPPGKRISWVSKRGRTSANAPFLLLRSDGAPTANSTVGHPINGCCTARSPTNKTRRARAQRHTDPELVFNMVPQVYIFAV